MNAMQKIVLTITATIIVAADAHAGRWLSRDPIQEGAGFVQRDPLPNDPNLYAFVDNNPVIFVDPLGLYLAAVDGTDSEYWVGQKQHGSFVKSFARDYAPLGDVDYENGPNLFGGGVSSTVDEVYNGISAALKKNPKEDINLVGHSRGGLIVILVAKKLHDNPPPCTKGEVKFMGLYDAVDRYLWADGSVIPDNVDFVAHARRDPGVNSRPLFGNTGTSGGKVYVQQFFWVTHSGAGGDPWGGDHPTMTTTLSSPRAGGNVTVPTITKDQDEAGSRLVDQWMRNNARQNGVNIP
jgi:hypothetical protein